MVSEARLNTMNEKADKVIATSSLGSLAGNLLPPPFDSMAVGAAIARMGIEIAKAYEVEVTWDEMKRIGMILAKGLGAVATASYIGTGLFKYVPGVNVWVALLVQPPIVGAMTYAAGQSYKQYFITMHRGLGNLTEEQLKDIASKAFLARKHLFK